MNIFFKLAEFYKETPIHLKVASVAWVTRIITAVIQVFSVRILISYLGTELYAGFAILTSLAGWFALAEFGLGSTLQNYVSEYRVKNKEIEYLYNTAVPGVFLLFIISIVFLLIISIPLQLFLFKNLSSSLLSQPFYITGMIGFFYILTALGGIAYRVYYGEQRGHLSNIYPAIGSIISFFLLIVIDVFNIYERSLALALIVFILPTALTALYAFYDVFFRNKNIYLSKFEFQTAKEIFSTAYKFAGFAFMSASVLQIDYIVMSRVLVTNDITIYNIISKVFFLIYFVYTAVLMALWPTCSELLGKNKIIEVNTLIKKHLFFGILIVSAGTISFIFTNRLISDILSSGQIFELPLCTIILFGIYYAFRAWSDTYAIILQSMSKIKIFWLYVPFQGLISFIAQYSLGSRLGLNGILIGISISFLATSVWILPLTYYKIIRER